MASTVKLTAFITKKSVIFLVALVAGGAGIAYLSRGGDAPSYDYVTAERGKLVQEVSVTGRVNPSRRVDLAFEKTGRLARLYASVGERVSSGALLARLEAGDAEALLAEAEAKLKSEEANLRELERGTRPEEINVQKVKVSNAEAAREDARGALINTLRDAYTKSDDAVRHRVDQLFTNPESSNPQIAFTVSDYALERKVESSRQTMGRVLTYWKNSLDTLAAGSDLPSFAEKAAGNLDDVAEFLSDVSLIANDLRATAELSQATVDGYKSDISTARTNVNTAISNLSDAEENLKNKESSLALAEEELVLKQAGATPEELAAQEARVLEAHARVARYEAELRKATIWSPIEGIVADVLIEEGETVSANAEVISLISAAEFEIEAHVPEADIAKLEMGDIARVTLDAYGSDVLFEARIVAVDPAETILEGVSTYETTLQFTKKDDRIRPGMTANIDIVTDTRSDAISVLARSVIEKDGERIVRKVSPSGGIEEVPVKTGLRSSDGKIEIIEGVEEGDKIVTFLENE